MYPDHPEQGFDYCALSIPFETYSTHFVYLDIPTHVETRRYTWTEVEARRQHLDNILDVIRLDEEYLPTPSEQACRWCSLSWRRGGDCVRAP